MTWKKTSLDRLTLNSFETCAINYHVLHKQIAQDLQGITGLVHPTYKLGLGYRISVLTQSANFPLKKFVSRVH